MFPMKHLTVTVYYCSDEKDMNLVLQNVPCVGSVEMGLNCICIYICNMRSFLHFI
jgi:hypothetical protein